MISMQGVRRVAEEMLISELDGMPLTDVDRALLRFAVHASVTTLDSAGIERHAAAALSAGASPDQVHETLELVSGLGVHSLMEGSPRLGAILRAAGDPRMTAPFDERQSELWQKYVGDDPYWQGMERSAPGFLDSLLRLSPNAFEAFFIYCSVPWRGGTVSARTKELIAMASDATPNHRYIPGMRLHLANALKLGAGRCAIIEALEIAASTPPHLGVA